jgi:polysaccharide biosynthesis protein PslG
LKKLLIVVSALLVLAAALFVAAPAWVEGLTGESARLPQVRALWNLALQQTRPPLNLAPEQVDRTRFPETMIGVNTFLEQEVEPVKRERQLQMIHAAGFTFIRQQFPWFDIESSAQGDFVDRRNAQLGAIDAWAKFDNIVDLAARNQIQVVARLDAPPKWAHAGYADLGDFGPPAKFEHFADFAAAVAQRYKGRITYYQLWNEPNIYPEWGEQRVNPEDYTRLLCLAHDRIKAIDPDAVVIAAALAPTVAQDGRDLSDLIFLQRMYQAGAARCFDVAAAQGYGLFSGPDDRRASPLETNVARHLLMRDVMVANGDARKPMWLSEVNWNALPERTAGIEGAGKFGNATPAQQARYVPRVIDRAKSEWRWVGAMSVWFFKPASEDRKQQAMYYFRMVEPDFTPLPLYDALRAYLTAKKKQPE